MFHICYEPIAIAALLGVLLVLKTSHERRIWLIVAGLALMAGWRLGYGGSSRYSVILVIPAVLLTVAACSLLPESLPSPLRQYRRAISRLLLTALILACLGQTFHVNPFDDYLIRGSEALRRDAAAFSRPLVLDFTDRWRVINYYSDVPAIGDGTVLTIGADDREIGYFLDQYCYFHDALYICVVRPQEKVTDELRFGDRKLELVFAGRRTARSESRFAIYRYRVPERLAAWQGEVSLPAAGADAVLFDDFENGAPPRWSREQLATLTRRNLPALATPEREFPAGWEANLAHGYEPGSNVEIGLDRKAVSGRTSLLLAADRPITLMTGKDFSCARDYELTLHYRGTPGSVFNVMVYFYNERGQYCGYRRGPAFTLQGEAAAPYRRRLEFSAAARRGRFKLVLFLEKGNVFFDDLCLAPTAENEKI